MQNPDLPMPPPFNHPALRLQEASLDGGLDFSGRPGSDYSGGNTSPRGSICTTGASRGDRGTSDVPAISFGRAWTRGVTDGARRDLATAGEWAAAKSSPLELGQSKA